MSDLWLDGGGPKILNAASELLEAWNRQQCTLLHRASLRLSRYLLRVEVHLERGVASAINTLVVLLIIRYVHFRVTAGPVLRLRIVYKCKTITN